MKLSKKLTLPLAYTAILLSTHVFANEAGIKSEEITVLADVAAIDKNEILLATIASNKKTSSDVMDFAKLMIDQHGSNLNQILELAKNLNIQSLTSNESNKLIQEGNHGMMKLGALQGKQFDQEYINSMVKGHQAALNLIDNHLMKVAKTESVKKFLTDTRNAVVQHLDHAKKLQESMKS